MPLPVIIFSSISALSVSLPLVAGVWTWKRLHNDLRYIVWLAITSAFVDAASIILGMHRINTFPIINLFVIAQFIFLAFSLRLLQSATVLKIFFWAVLAFSIANYFFIEKMWILNSYTAYSGGILLIFTTFRILYQTLKEIPVQKIQTQPFFWLVFGVLIYYGGTLFIFLFSNYFITHHFPELHRAVWMLHNVLNTTKNIFFFLAIWVNYKGKISLS